MGDLYFHILDVKDRDEIVVSEDEDIKAVEYESGIEEESDAEEVQQKAKKGHGKGWINPDARLVVHLFGSTAEGKSVRVDCKGFEPFFFVRIHEVAYAKQGPACLRAYIMQSMNLLASSPVLKLIKFKLVWRKLMYGYTGGKEFPFVEVKVPSLQLFREVRKQFLNEKQEPFLKYPDKLDRPFQKGVAPKIYEANLDPYLRFMHLRNLKPCDWCTIKGGLDMVDDVSQEVYAIDDCNWEDIGPCGTPPVPTAPFRVASWDIECYSASGDFPVALNGDPVIQIGTVLTTLGSKENEKHVFVLDTCDPIEGATVHSFKTEAGLIKGWFDWIVKRDVDILIGYNIFGFDEQYIWHRCDKLKLTNVESIQQLNRLSDYGGEMRLEEKRLSSSAMGDNFLHLWNTTGRLRIDLYHAIKRQYQMGSYKLDDTSIAFLNDSVKKVVEAVGDTWSIETTGDAVRKQGATAGRALVLLNESGDSLCEKCTITEVTDSGKIVFTAPIDVDEADVSKWAIVKDDLSPQDMFKKQKGSSADRAIIAEYCIQDCQLVLDMFRKLDTFNNAASMANVCSVPVAHIFLRGQGIKIESLIFKYCYENNLAIEVMPSPGFRDSGGTEEGATVTESYEGAIVLDPIPGLYTTPVGVADFASLYPSTIISENISHDTLVSVMEYTLDGKFIKQSWGQEFSIWNTPESIAFTDIEFDIWGADPEDKRKNPEKIKTGIRVCRYAQDKQGAIPIIIAQLLDARKKTRALIKTEADPFKKALLDAQQNAYKITANSLYGQLGSGTFKIRLQNLAASVTAYGRKQIMFAKSAIEKFYGPGSGNPKCCCDQVRTVYGDSVGEGTLLTVKLNDGSIVRTTFDSIAELYSYNWIPCIDSIDCYYSSNGKESCETPGLQTLTEKGWTAVHRIIRHKLPPGKKMLTIMYMATLNNNEYSYASIEVTNDHSMLLSDGTAIKPTSLKKGDKLCCNTTSYELIVTTVIELKGYSGYVYDMTTDNNHFQAGSLGLVVHNTDSLFIAFHPKDPATGKELEGEASMRATIELTEEAGKLVTQALKAPHDFEFDKVYWPFLIFSKKRYVGHKYEDPDHYTLTSMGIALKRRDYAPIVKKIYGGAIHILLTEKDVAKAAHFVRNACRELIEGKYGLGPLTITKSLRAEYSDPTRIAHKVLADRIALRSPGNAPAAGDRIGYIYVQPTVGQIASDLQGDRIETPAYIREKGLKPDYMFYIDHQISSPVCQVFGLLIEQIPGYIPRVWSEDPLREAKERETYAYELLFQDAIAVNNNSAKRRFVQLFGGVSSVPLPSKGPTEGTVKRNISIGGGVTKRPIKAQSSLDSFLADTVRISAHKASIQKKKKEADK